MPLLGLGGVVADLMVKPFHPPVFDKPSEYGLTYEDVEFKAEDGVTIRGWLVNPGKSKVIVQTHFGVQCSRCGWTREGKNFMASSLHPEDVKFLRHIKHLSDAGYTTLAYDLRHHGESDPGTNKLIGDGQEEYKDVVAAVKFLSEHKDYSSASIGLLSLCMGSSATVHAFAAENGLRKYPNIKAMIAIQPHYSGLFLNKYGIPKFIVDAAARNAMSRGGVDFRRNPVEQVPTINVPTMVMQNKNDPYHDHEFVQAWHDALQGEKEMLWTDLGKTRFYGYAYFGEHPEKMLEWFGKYM